MIEKLTFSLTYVMLTGALLFGLRRFRSASPLFWHPVALTVMALGTFSLSNISDEIDLYYIFLHFVALFAYAATTLVYIGSSNIAGALRAYEARKESDAHQNVKVTIFILAGVSAVITIVYYMAVGFNVVFLLLSKSGIDGSYSDLRISAYSGDRYFAPGYANQFKNMLLPICLTCMGYWIFQGRPRREFVAYILAAVPFALFALAGTGQRGFLFYTAAALAMGAVLHRLGRPTRISPVLATAVGVPVFGLFMLMTHEYYLGSAQASGNILLDILARFTSIQQESALAGFRYVYTLDTAWGAEWLQAFRGILPGQEGSRLAHEVHAILYGSDRGTAPVSTIGSAYYNGGLVGVLLLFSLLGWIYSAVYRTFLKGPRTIVRSISYGFLFFYLTIWVYDAPTILLDNGALTVVLLLLINQLVTPRGVVSVDRTRPSGFSRRAGKWAR